MVSFDLISQKIDSNKNIKNLKFIFLKHSKNPFVFIIKKNKVPIKKKSKEI